VIYDIDDLERVRATRNCRVAPRTDAPENMQTATSDVEHVFSTAQQTRNFCRLRNSTFLKRCPEPVVFEDWMRCGSRRKNGPVE